jgi:hypothetical protein
MELGGSKHHGKRTPTRERLVISRVNLGQLFNTKNMMKISKTLEKLVEFTLKFIYFPRIFSFLVV